MDENYKYYVMEFKSGERIVSCLPLEAWDPAWLPQVQQVGVYSTFAQAAEKAAEGGKYYPWKYPDPRNERYAADDRVHQTAKALARGEIDLHEFKRRIAK